MEEKTEVDKKPGLAQLEIGGCLGVTLITFFVCLAGVLIAVFGK